MPPLLKTRDRSVVPLPMKPDCPGVENPLVYIFIVSFSIFYPKIPNERETWIARGMPVTAVALLAEFS